MEYGDLNERTKSIMEEAIQRAKSHYEEVKHPNIEEQEEEEELKKKPPIRKKSYFTPEELAQRNYTSTAWAQWLMEWDETVLRPFFIRNYDPERAELEDAYNDEILRNYQEDEMKVEDFVERVQRLQSVHQGGNAGRSMSAFDFTGGFGRQNRGKSHF